MLNYIICDNEITVIVDNKPYTIFSDDKRYSSVLEAIRSNDEAALRNAVMVEDKVQKYFIQGGFYVKDGIIYSPSDTPLPTSLCNRILKMIDEQIPYEFLLRFWNRLEQNPEPSSVEQLYTFLEHNHIPITENGTFLAYKGVTKDLKDKWSGKIVYRIGEQQTMNREDVLCDPNEPCGPGLHVGTYEYAKGWAGNDGALLLVEVDPKDVVSVPRDANHQKCRVCKLKVLSYTDVPVEKSGVLVGDALGTIKIGNAHYVAKVVDSLPAGVIRIKPSKYPKVFKQMDDVGALYRIKSSVGYKYYALTVDQKIVEYIQAS